MNEIKKIIPPLCVKERQSGIELLRLIAMLLVIGVFYVSSLAIDQIRLLIWNRLAKYMKI